MFKRFFTTMVSSRCVIGWFLILAALCGCSKEVSAPVAKDDNRIRVGGLYATQEKSGSWRVMKVLAVDEFSVHLRSYANKLTEQPMDVDPGKLTLGGTKGIDGIGIGHFPLAIEGFLNEKPILIKVVPVQDEELEGYKYYLDAMKGAK